ARQHAAVRDGRLHHLLLRQQKKAPRYEGLFLLSDSTFETLYAVSQLVYPLPLGLGVDFLRHHPLDQAVVLLDMRTERFDLGISGFPVVFEIHLQDRLRLVILHAAVEDRGNSRDETCQDTGYDSSEFH
ncbi:hypothetical protein, partial [Paratractidigestivibacter sp.]|uniref:hypothetical protein n=1 Tax=Paratractidigestivibacter sp. TaxID=2847316 RepID=UPI002AC8E904